MLEACDGTREEGILQPHLNLHLLQEHKADATKPETSSVS